MLVRTLPHGFLPQSDMTVTPSAPRTTPRVTGRPLTGEMTISHRGALSFDLCQRPILLVGVSAGLQDMVGLRLIGDGAMKGNSQVHRHAVIGDTATFQ